MKKHEYKADSDWTICHSVNSQFVSILTFREWRDSPGYQSRFMATDCIAFESDNHAETINAALIASRADPRESTFVVHETWIIEKPERLAGKRDNKRIN